MHAIRDEGVTNIHYFFSTCPSLEIPLSTVSALCKRLFCANFDCSVRRTFRCPLPKLDGPPDAPGASGEKIGYLLEFGKKAAAKF
jgi:hypothetical protein